MLSAHGNQSSSTVRRVLTSSLLGPDRDDDVCCSDAGDERFLGTINPAAFGGHTDDLHNDNTNGSASPSAQYNGALSSTLQVGGDVYQYGFQQESTQQEAHPRGRWEPSWSAPFTLPPHPHGSPYGRGGLSAPASRQSSTSPQSSPASAVRLSHTATLYKSPISKGSHIQNHLMHSPSPSSSQGLTPSSYGDPYHSMGIEDTPSVVFGSGQPVLYSNAEPTRCSTPPNRQPMTPASNSPSGMVYSPPPDFTHRQHSPPTPHNQSAYGTPSKQSTRDTSPIGRMNSPAAALFSTPVRRTQNSLTLSPYGGSYHGTPHQLTPGGRNRLSSMGTSPGGGLTRSTAPGSLFRRQESVSAVRVLDGTGIVRDPLVKPITYGIGCHLLAALTTTVFQWTPNGVTTLLEAPSMVTAVTSSNLGDCVHLYAAVGLCSGIIHIYELDQEGGVISTLMDSQLQGRVTSLCMYEDMLYAGSEDGYLLVMDMRERFYVQRAAEESKAGNVRSTTPTTHLVGSGTGRCRERIDLTATIYTMEITEDGNHLAIGTSKGLYVLHRTKQVPELIDDSAPVTCVSWAQRSLGLGILVYVLGCRGSKLVIRSLSAGIKCTHNTYAQIVALRCCRNTPECVVAHADSVGPTGLSLTPCGHDDLLVMYDLQGLKIRKSTKFTGHREPVHCLMLDPTGNVLISACSDSSIRFWDVASPHVAEAGALASLLASLCHSNITGPLRTMIVDRVSSGQPSSFGRGDEYAERFGMGNEMLR